MQIRAAFAENLRRTRRAIGLSQKELAYRAEIDRTYLSALERGVYSALTAQPGSPDKTRS
jgi:transcriptional regulator with XRE-family HTH domain